MQQDAQVVSGMINPLEARVMLSEKHYIDLKHVYDEDCHKSTLNKLWLFRVIGIPSDDPEESHDGYEGLGYDTYWGFLISASNVEEAAQVFTLKLKEHSIYYHTSHWTVDRIGLDTKANLNNPYIVISEFHGG